MLVVLDSARIGSSVSLAALRFHSHVEVQMIAVLGDALLSEASVSPCVSSVS